MADLIERLLRATVRLETENSVGTGFFYQYKRTEEMFAPVIVSNRHMFENHNQLKIEFWAKNNSEKLEKILLPICNLQQSVIYHPNPEIDLAILPIAGIHNLFIESKYEPQFIYLGSEILPSKADLDDMSALEDVIVIGYPNGLYDKENLRPLIRKGITASDIKVDYENQPIFIIDCEIVPGSSGSPVFIYNPVGRFSSNSGISIGNTYLKFVGINSAVFTQNIQGEITQTPTSLISNTPSYIGLGIILKSSLLDDFDDLLGKAERERENETQS
ncbi:MAG: serine protease [Streptococcaceae bacterium]|jgi:hypothetical protein|nr:serine protease [Streptococcaceae bacterium]